MSLPWLKRSSVLPPCPLGIAKSHLAYKTLCLALFLTFHHSFIPQTFMEHLCVPGSALGAEGDGGEWSLSSRCLRLLPWISQPCWDGFLTLMCSILSYLVPWPLCIGFSAFPSLSPTSELLFVFFLKLKSDHSLHGDFHIFVDNHSTLHYLKKKKNEFIGRLWGGRTETELL